MTKADLSNQTLKARSVQCRSTRAAEIIVDNDDLFAPPAKPAGPIGETILEAR
jgi:hypothetical protein